MIQNIQQVVEAIENVWATRKLLVVGDLMLDKYIWGEVARISPEAPVPVVRAMHRSEQPGGAANVAMNLVRLGAEVCLAGFIGKDEDGRLLEVSLQTNNIVPLLIEREEFPTIAKLRILGGRQQMLRLDTEQVSASQSAAHRQLLDRVVEEIPKCHAVVLSDYAKGVLTPEVCQEIIRAARMCGIPVLVDPKSADFSRYRGATTICPNLNELRTALRTSEASIDALLAASEQMVTSFGLNYLLATLSENGIALVRPGSLIILPAQARQVFDVSGAGDTVIAMMALCLACEFTPELAAQVANVAAGVVVGKVGTMPVERHELLAALVPEIALHAKSKVVTLAELVSRTALWKANGERVVFANGCFDLLHVGHITLLEQARRVGDRLIVAINSDASVRRLKGPQRPIVEQEQRARVLAALAAVDAVVTFDEPTPLESILAVRPDVIVKGGDYSVETVVGAREVQSWGGEVKIVPILEGYSTTQLIAKGAGE